MATDDILVINAAQMKARTRTTKSGAPGKTSTVITMTVTSEPITYNVSEAFLLKAASEALAKSIREQTQAISEPVKAATARARKVAEKAFAAGKPWALERYSGGRTGVTPPQASARTAFVHSGRLAESIVARYVEKEKSFYINYAANRWDPKNWSSLAAMQVAIQKWIDRVPALKEPSADLAIQRAFRETHGQMVEKHRMGTEAARAKAQVSTLRLVGEVAAGALT